MLGAFCSQRSDYNVIKADGYGHGAYESPVSIELDAGALSEKDGTAEKDQNPILILGIRIPAKTAFY